jgi:hypothetical protein
MSNYTISNEDRIFCYLWYETTDKDECKFGEHWVKAGQNPHLDISKYIRNDMNKRKDKFDDGIVQIKCIWDVSEYAKQYKKHYVGSHLDNHIRNQIGFVKQGEVHKLSPEKMQDKVNEVLRKSKQPLQIAELPTAPYDAVCEIVSHLKDGKKKILGQLAPRFRKTLTESFIALEMEWDLTIIATYVPNVFYGFKNQLRQYEQFRNIEIIDCSDKDYQQQIKKALKDKKKVFALLSLCNGSKREERCEFLYGLCKRNRGTIIEEADLGAHKSKQVDVLKKYQSEKDIVIITTGTNGEKAINLWDIDAVVEFTYFELLINKSIEQSK